MNLFPFQNNTAQPLQNIPLPPKTTKIYVTSQEDALARPAEPNSEISYFHQNGKMLFEVYTDQWGRKQLQAFAITPYTESTETKDLTAEINGIKERIEMLEKTLKGGVKNDTTE